MNSDSGKCEYKNIEKDVNEILPKIYLGNEKSAYNIFFLKKYQIKHIIRIMPEFDFRNMAKNVNYLHIPLKDNEICSKNLNKLFDFVANYIANVIKKDEPILIHCKRGHHRSASLIAGFMIRHLGVDFNTSLEYINDLRPCALRRDACIVKSLFNYYLYLGGMSCKNFKCIKNNNVQKCYCT